MLTDSGAAVDEISYLLFPFVICIDPSPDDSHLNVCLHFLPPPPCPAKISLAAILIPAWTIYPNFFSRVTTSWLMSSCCLWKDLCLTLGPYIGPSDFHLYSLKLPHVDVRPLKLPLPVSRKKSLSLSFQQITKPIYDHLLFPQLKIFSINGAGLAVSGTIPTSVLFLEFLGLFLRSNASLSLSFYLVWQTAPVFFLTHCQLLFSDSTNHWYMEAKNQNKRHFSLFLSNCCQSKCLGL